MDLGWGWRYILAHIREDWASAARESLKEVQGGMKVFKQDIRQK